MLLIMLIGIIERFFLLQNHFLSFNMYYSSVKKVSNNVNAMRFASKPLSYLCMKNCMKPMLINSHFREMKAKPMSVNIDLSVFTAIFLRSCALKSTLLNFLNIL